MKTEKVYPAAGRLIESLCDLGYETHTAIADLIDNSIAAHSSSIHVDVIAEEDDDPHVYIADNGDGMSRDELKEAMRFGSFQTYEVSALGKFGLGLKTASLSQCRTLTVITKSKAPRARLVVARWDLKFVSKKENDWELQFPEEKSLAPFEQALIKQHLQNGHGTIIVWSNLRETFADLSSAKADIKDKFYSNILKVINNHLAMIFHRFIEGSVRGKRRVKIHVAGEEVVGWDPFCRHEKKTSELDVKNYAVTTKNKKFTVEVRPYIIPREDEYPSKEAFSRAKGHQLFNNHQGFYYYRNGRMLKMGGWSGMRSNDEHTKLVRVSVDFPDDLDELFAINITKMTAKIPTQISKQLKDDSAKWITEGKRRYDKKDKNGKKPSPSSTKVSQESSPRDYKFGKFSISPSALPNKAPVISASKKGDIVNIEISPSSPLYSLVSGANTANGDLRKLVFVLLSYIESIQSGRKKASEIPYGYLLKKAKELV